MTFIYLVPEYRWYSVLALSFGIRSKTLTVKEIWQFKVFQKIIAWKYSNDWIWPNWWPGVTRIEVLSSYNPIPGFQEGTVRHTAVTNIEKIWHGLGHYSSYTLGPICIFSTRWSAVPARNASAVHANKCPSKFQPPNSSFCGVWDVQRFWRKGCCWLPLEN